MGNFKDALLQARGVFAFNFQSLKEQAFPTLMSGPFSNMTESEMYKYVWKNITKQKALEVPSYRDFLCQRLGSEGCELLNARYAVKRDFPEESTLFRYEKNKAFSYVSGNYLKPHGGISDISNALKNSAKSFGVKMFSKEKVKQLNRKGDVFAVRTDHFLVSAKKLVIAVPSFAFEAFMGDVATDVKENVLFGSILPANAFKAVAIYSYPWWENATSSRNRTVSKPTVERFWSASTCLVGLMPYR